MPKQTKQSPSPAQSQARASGESVSRIERPQPPEDVAEEALHRDYELFRPDRALARWVRDTFIYRDAPLHNPDHAELEDAFIGFVWTNAPNAKRGRRILGTAELPSSQGTWSAARTRGLLRDWFGRLPDFLITLYAPYEASTTDAQFCALLEHELYHCRQAVNDYGDPLWSSVTNAPLWTIKGHDVEEFTGVIRRYGVVTSDVAALVDAASRPPLIDAAELAGVCGTCAR